MENLAIASVAWAVLAAGFMVRAALLASTKVHIKIKKEKENE